MKKKYHTVETVWQSHRRIIQISTINTPNTQAHDRSLYHELSEKWPAQLGNWFIKKKKKINNQSDRFYKDHGIDVNVIPFCRHYVFKVVNW